MTLDDIMVTYQTKDNKISIDVKIENETVWLSQSQMAELFQTDRTSILRHINNIYKTGELDRDSTCAKFAQVHQEGNRQVSRQIPLYNLDMIISVGYRVNSKQGTQFRIWANNVLKEYMIKGYAINNEITAQKFDELSHLVNVLARIVGQPELTSRDDSEMVRVVSDYAYALNTIDRYDYQSLDIQHTTKSETFRITYENAIEAIKTLKGKFKNSSLFANEKDNSFRSSIGQIYQTFDGNELYPSVEEKAATLLYLVVKNHSFTDGNKRIAATLFLWFLEMNGILYSDTGNKRIADNTLVALTLMIAVSKMEEKDLMIKVVVNLINRDNH